MGVQPATRQGTHCSRGNQGRQGDAPRDHRPSHGGAAVRGGIGHLPDGPHGERVPQGVRGREAGNRHRQRGRRRCQGGCGGCPRCGRQRGRSGRSRAACIAGSRQRRRRREAPRRLGRVQGGGRRATRATLASRASRESKAFLGRKATQGRRAILAQSSPSPT